VLWPTAGEVFALSVGGRAVPPLLIATMSFVLISNSGARARAVTFGSRHNRRVTAALMAATALLGLSFVSMQGFEWHKLIFEEHIRPWGNPLGAPQFGACFFMITGFHGLHVSAGVIMLSIVAVTVLRGHYERKSDDS